MSQSLNHQVMDFYLSKIDILSSLLKQGYRPLISIINIPWRVERRNPLIIRSWISTLAGVLAHHSRLIRSQSLNHQVMDFYSILPSTLEVVKQASRNPLIIRSWISTPAEHHQVLV